MTFFEGQGRGLPYGGLPYTEILSKMEETDMNVTDEDIVTNYDKYMRSEITDRTLDVPYLESDTTRRDTSLSKSILNLRYNGSRGEYDMPKHPEMFVGFMDQDNRGLDNNPRMNKYQQQINSRMPLLTPRMGNNNTDHITESPWTNQSLGQCRRDIQTSLAYNTKVFTDERDGRAPNRNFVTEYDHNKKQLIYKDLLPATMDPEHAVGKTNTNYTVSSRPMVSHDSDFKTMYDSMSYSGLIPKNNICSSNCIHDHPKGTEEENNNSNKYALQHGSKVVSNKLDQVYVDEYSNRSQGKLRPGPTITGLNIDNDITYNDTYNSRNVSNKMITPITNTTYIDGDVNMPIAFIDSQGKQYDLMKYSNGFMDAEIQMYEINDPNITTQKNYIRQRNNINITNSDYNIPEYKFKHIDTGRHAVPADNQNLLAKYQEVLPNTYQIESNNTNKYIFNDDIRLKMTNTYMNIYDQTSESHMRHVGDLKQEHKFNNMNHDTTWATSDENEISKSQKQSRTSGTEDPYIIEVPDYNDFEISNGGAIIGKKLIRGDYMDFDNTVVNEVMVS